MSHCPNYPNATCNAIATTIRHGSLTEFQSLILLVGVAALAIFLLGKIEGDTDDE